MLFEHPVCFGQGDRDIGTVEVVDRRAAADAIEVGVCTRELPHIARLDFDAVAHPRGDEVGAGIRLTVGGMRFWIVAVVTASDVAGAEIVEGDDV